MTSNMLKDKSAFLYFLITFVSLKNILCHLGIRTICSRQCTDTVSASLYKTLIEWRQCKVSLLMKRVLLAFQTSTSMLDGIKCQLQFYKITSSHKQICSWAPTFKLDGKNNCQFLIPCTHTRLCTFK